MELLPLLPQPPKKLPRIVELLQDESEPKQENASFNGLALALSAVDNVTGSSDVTSTPLTTRCVRRSPRANKYDGFKCTAIRDVKAKKSKVKAIVKPSVVPEADVPPPTPISTLQCIGVKLCGVPPEEVSPVKLLASLHEQENKED